MVRRILRAGAFVAALYCTRAVSGAIIYQDNFPGAATDLNGAMPSPIDTGNATWTAAPGKFTENSGSVTPSAPGPGNYNGYSAFLPISLTGSGTYSFTDTVIPTAGVSSDWLATGFVSSAATSNTFYNNPVNGQLWILYRDNGQVQSFFGGGTNNSETDGTGTPGAADTFTFTVNPSSGSFTISDTDGLINRAGTLSNASITAIQDVGIGQYQTESGSFSNVSVSVPEPVSISALSLAGVAMIVRGRRMAR